MYQRTNVHKNTVTPVIYGRFPRYVYSKSSAENVNKFLSTVLIGLVILSLVSYYYVSDREKTMNNLGREIVSLSNENIELQNKLDNLNSFNKVDAVIHGNISLDSAKKVIEVPAVDNTYVPKVQPIPVNYSWSVGY